MHARSAAIILLRLDGVGMDEAAIRLNITAKLVMLWSRRFATFGLAGPDDRPGRDRKPSIPPARVPQVLPKRPARGWEEPLEHPFDGTPCRGLRQFGAAHLVRPRFKATPRRNLQAVKRSAG
jgi:hypothetical protein